MNVELSARSETLLREYLETGKYSTPEDVIEHALETLAEKERNSESHERSILHLQGLGKETWRGMDAQTYVDQERSGWNG